MEYSGMVGWEWGVWNTVPGWLAVFGLGLDCLAAVGVSSLDMTNEK